MHLPPPFAVLAILALMISAAVWWAPPAPRNTEVTIRLPVAVYDGLARRMEEEAGPDGRTETMAGAIERLTSQSVLDGGAH